MANILLEVKKMGKKVVILGGGTGGVVVASRLSKILKEEIKNQKLEVYLIDKNPLHEFRPSYL
jgi:sulfide:quinone oxidoreductase